MCGIISHIDQLVFYVKFVFSFPLTRVSCLSLFVWAPVLVFMFHKGNKNGYCDADSTNFLTPFCIWVQNFHCSQSVVIKIMYVFCGLWFYVFDEPKSSKEIDKLNKKKACLENYIPVKLMKLNKYFFSYFMCLKLNKLLFSSNFPWILKASDILPTNKKKSKSDIENYIVQLIFHLRSLKCIAKCMNILIKFFQNINI